MIVRKIEPNIEHPKRGVDYLFKIFQEKDKFKPEYQHLYLTYDEMNKSKIFDVTALENISLYDAIFYNYKTNKFASERKFYIIFLDAYVSENFGLSRFNFIMDDYVIDNIKNGENIVFKCKAKNVNGKDEYVDKYPSIENVFIDEPYIILTVGLLRDEDNTTYKIALKLQEFLLAIKYSRYIYIQEKISYFQIKRFANENALQGLVEDPDTSGRGHCQAGDALKTGKVFPMTIEWSYVNAEGETKKQFLDSLQFIPQINPSTDLINFSKPKLQKLCYTINFKLAVANIDKWNTLNSKSGIAMKFFQTQFLSILKDKLEDLIGDYTFEVFIEFKNTENDSKYLFFLFDLLIEKKEKNKIKRSQYKEEEICSQFPKRIYKSQGKTVEHKFFLCNKKLPDILKDIQEYLDDELWYFDGKWSFETDIQAYNRIQTEKNLEKAEERKKASKNINTKKSIEKDIKKIEEEIEHLRDFKYPFIELKESYVKFGEDVTKLIY